MKPYLRRASGVLTKRGSEVERVEAGACALSIWSLHFWEMGTCKAELPATVDEIDKMRSDCSTWLMLQRSMSWSID